MVVLYRRFGDFSILLSTPLPSKHSPLKSCLYRFSVIYGGVFHYFVYVIHTVLRNIHPIAKIVLGRHFHHLYLPLIRQNVSRAQRSWPIDRKQSETVYDYVSISLLPRFCVVSRRKQDVNIGIFLSFASCLRSLVICRDER